MNVPLAKSFFSKFFILFLSVFLSGTSSFSQYRVDYGIVAGFASSAADVGGSSLFQSRFSNKNLLGFPRYVAGVYGRYKVHRNFSARANLNFVRLAGSDRNSRSSLIYGRNLNFATTVIEASVQGEWNFLQITRMPGWSLASHQRKSRADARMYLLAGMGLFYYQPTAQFGGKRYNLRRFANEGVRYFPFSICFPVGIGFSYAINQFRKFSIDVSYRYTLTDYLDDASSRYANKTEGTLEEVISNPNTMLQPGSTTSDGKPVASSYNYGWDETRALGLTRGNPKKNDGYVMVTASLGIMIKGANDNYRMKKKSLRKIRMMGRKKTRAKF